MNIRRFTFILVQCLWFSCCSILYAQDPPPPGIPAPQEEEVDHTAANEKLAKEIQKAIDALHELKDAEKIEILKKIKKHIEDNKKNEPGKNIDDAIKKALKKGEGTPDWLDKLVRKWKKSLGILSDPLQYQWSYRPFLYQPGSVKSYPDQAWLTWNNPANDEFMFLNARMRNASSGKEIWLLQNVPLPSFGSDVPFRIKMNLEELAQDGKLPGQLIMAYHIGSFQTNSAFKSQVVVTLNAQPEPYCIRNGGTIGAHPLIPRFIIPPKIIFPHDSVTLQNLHRRIVLLDSILLDSLKSARSPIDQNLLDSLLHAHQVLDAEALGNILRLLLQGDGFDVIAYNFMMAKLLIIDSYFRGCEVPNVDLDAASDPSDFNACGPAAAANSLSWLESQHDEIFIPMLLRGLLDSLKSTMKHSTETGVAWDNFIKGKLDFIEENQLPIHVKYQSHAGAPDEIASDNPDHKHVAKNKSEPNPEGNPPYLHPTYEWMMSELKAGEDVEMLFGYYCDTIVIVEKIDSIKVTVLEDGTIKRDTFKSKEEVKKRVRTKIGHFINVTGAISVGERGWITYKQDVDQSGPGGTTEDNTPEGKRFTDISGWVTDDKGYSFLPQEGYIDQDGDQCTAFVESVVSESYDPSVTYDEDEPTYIHPYPWNEVTLTGVQMKPFYPAIISHTNNFPFIPVIGGVVGSGVLIYVLTREKKDDCMLSATSALFPATCNLANGSIVITTNVEATYIWSNGATSKDLVSVIAGNYSVTVTQTGTSCSQILQISLPNVDQPITTTIATTPASCGQSNGSAIPSIEPPGTYTFQWSTGSTNQVLENVNAGVYMLTVTAAGTCRDITTVNIEELPAEFTVSISETPAHCGMNDGAATATVEPSADYTFLWSNGQTSAQLQKVAAGNYNLTVTLNGTNCSITSGTTISELPPAFLITASAQPASCGKADGTASVLVDPPGSYSFLWPDGQTTSNATGLSVGSYTVTVTLAGTVCSKTMDVTVGELPPAFTIDFTTTPSGCTTSNGTATATVNTPGEYTFAWSNGQTTTQATGLAPGLYTVSVTLTGSTCTVVNSISVEQTAASFTGTTTTTPADCGIANGSAVIVLDPPGQYTFLWSNQQTMETLTNVASGMYSVTVTDINSCTASFSAEVNQIPPAFFVSLTSLPGDCTGGGEIFISLTTPGSGPLQLEIVSAQGNTTLSLAPGSYSLSTFINILPGFYNINVFDQGLGSMCMESQQVNVVDDTPTISTINDVYFTTTDQPVSGNMLDNDDGLNLMVTAITNVVGGTVVFDANGDFNFTPATGFSGDASFSYTATDACGNTSTGIVTITVEQIECMFTIQVTTNPAHCDLSDGYVNVEVNEPGSYAYTWSNGQSGSELENVPADLYGLTITDLSLGCFLEFEIELTEFPATYVNNIEIFQPTCSQPGEIIFDVSAPYPQDILTMVVTHPNGTDEFEIDPQTILLSDYVDINPGNFTIEIYIGNAGPGCIDDFSATINLPPTLVIELDEVFPPSSPGAMDGLARITATTPGSLPYLIFVDGIPSGTANTHTFQVGGLGVGLHEIQIQDANGCLSNILQVLVPFPDIIFSFGTGGFLFPSAAAPKEQAVSAEDYVLSSGVVVTMQYHLAKIPQRIRFIGLPGTLPLKKHDLSGYQVEHRTQCLSYNRDHLHLTAEGGFGVEVFSVSSDIQVHPFFAGGIVLEYKVGRQLKVQVEAGYKSLIPGSYPYSQINISSPFIH